MQVRDWLYVKDHCQAILDIILKGEVGQIYNIAGRNEINNLEMIDSILRRIGKSSELIEHTNDRQGHDFRYSVDDGKLRSLGWEPRISFEDGLDYKGGHHQQTRSRKKITPYCDTYVSLASN